jgi:tripartite-type tricarboxylate transporter receptor subunit TctC
LIALAALAAAAALPAMAQDKWPSKTIEIIYPYPPGNDMDVVTRLVAEGMSKRLGVPVQVSNKPGGGGVVGFAEMIRAKPDGYTIGTWTPGPGISQIIAGNTPYKISDYQSVGAMLINDFVLAARGDIPATNLKEFAAWAKKSGKPVVIGSYAPAAVPALIAARIAKKDGRTYKVVAFPNPSAKELIAGDADMTTAGADGAISFAKAGQVKILSTWRPQRNPAFPNTATPAGSVASTGPPSTGGVVTTSSGSSSTGVHPAGFISATSVSDSLCASAFAHSSGIGSQDVKNSRDTNMMRVIFKRHLPWQHG